MRYRLNLLLAVLTVPVAAQRQQPPARGAAAITTEDVRRRIGIIAADSMLGRATPSPQLDQVAAYVASEFRRFGLKPGGDSGTYLQHYPLEVQRFDPDSASIRIAGPLPATWRTGQDVLLVDGQPPAGDSAGAGVVITGSPQGAAALDSTAVTGKVIFLAYGPSVNAIAVKVLPLHPLALLLVADFPDSIWNGADDDGSGTVAVLELAQAFTTARERPKRSLVFMTVSGEERGLWGSAYFADHPTLPLASVVADLNSDMVGRNAKDTLAVIGREHSNLGRAVDSIALAHPELNIKPVGDLWPQEGLYYRSDHYNFAKKGVPILFFTTGLHPDYHQVSDSPDKIDAEKEARFARLVFYLGLAVANTTARPQWNAESYKQIVGSQ